MALGVGNGPWQDPLQVPNDADHQLEDAGDRQGEEGRNDP